MIFTTVRIDDGWSLRATVAGRDFQAYLDDEETKIVSQRFAAISHELEQTIDAARRAAANEMLLLVGDWWELP